ncbi:MAG: tetratricopeptide repeat protein [Flavobacteriaceae bacterium]|tara:strand:- start:16140 stop:16922 length:783 start_codon:yes stop_codon:yes gene_type:complete
MNWKYVFFIISFSINAQIEKENNYISKGNGLHEDKSYVNAEGEFRKALSINQNNPVANQNLGNTLYRSKDYDQANQRFFRSQKDNPDKNQKHLAFHNMGNVFMKKKDYPKAVEAYKNALRNNPKDDETRYNYALAKEMLEKEKKENKNDKDKNKDKNKDQNKKENKNNENKSDENDKKKNSEGDKENKADNKKNKSNKEDKKGKNRDNTNKSQPKRNPGQLSKEQIKSLLEAMNQQEKNVQDKVNAKKEKGIPIKKKKDW